MEIFGLSYRADWNLQGVPAFSELGFAAAALPKQVKVAAVTGTNGKSTVTTFTSQVDKIASVNRVRIVVHLNLVLCPIYFVPYPFQYKTIIVMSEGATCHVWLKHLEKLTWHTVCIHIVIYCGGSILSF